MFTLSEEHLKKVKYLILAVEIVLTFLLCTWMLYIYHEYSETDSELENSEKLRIQSLKKILGNNGKYVIRTNVDPNMTQGSIVHVHDHILGEFLIVCAGIFFIGLLVLGAVIDFRKPPPIVEEVTTTNYSEMVTRF